MPAPGSGYRERLAWRVANGIEYDKRRALMEERRMAEAVRVADEIAAALGETGDRPKAQIRRIVGLMGAQWTSDACEAAAAVKAGTMKRRDFFRCFTDRPKKPKAAKAPVARKPKASRPDPHAARSRLHDKRSKTPVPVEVYVTRRRP